MKIVLFLAEGFEEIEALTVVDILRRGKCEIVTMSVDDKTKVIGKSEIEVFADMPFDKKTALDAEMIILPGGGLGTENIKNSENVIEVIKDFSEKGKKISAICAAPYVLGINGVLKGFKATCYPGFEKFLDGADIVDANVVCDRNIITSKGPGTAMEFALAILKELRGAECEKAVRDGLIY